MVPVIDQNGKCLFPCKERRARCLMKKKAAVAYWQKGIFCIKLVRQESDQRGKYPDLALGIDPGSKREGYTVACAKGVVLNILTNTPDWVKKHIQTRRFLRRNRRSRKTPYRAWKYGRSINHSNQWMPPSTKARWNAKLRITKQLLRILPITHINIEDIKAISKKGKSRWNKIFSPLQYGKNWFYAELKKIVPITVITQGYDTKKHRDLRGFSKSKNKLSDTWNAHNVDSHCLAEIALKMLILPIKSIYRITFLKYHRRQLHIMNAIKGGIRKQYGTTISLGMSRGSVVRYKSNLAYLGGSSRGKITIRSIETGKIVKRYADIHDVKIMYITKQRTTLIEIDH